MVTRTTFKSNKLLKGRSIIIFEIIHQGPQDTIIFHIQNKKVCVNGGKKFQCYPYGASLWNSQKPEFLKNAVANILKWNENQK